MIYKAPPFVACMLNWYLPSAGISKRPVIRIQSALIVSPQNFVLSKFSVPVGASVALKALSLSVIVEGDLQYSTRTPRLPEKKVLSKPLEIFGHCKKVRTLGHSKSLET